MAAAAAAVTSPAAAGVGGGLRQLFVLSEKLHGRGKVIFAWNADGTYLCTAGSNGALLARLARRATRMC